MRRPPGMGTMVELPGDAGIGEPPLRLPELGSVHPRGETRPRGERRAVATGEAWSSRGVPTAGTAMDEAVEHAVKEGT